MATCKSERKSSSIPFSNKIVQYSFVFLLMVVLQVTYLRLATLKISCDSVLWIYGKSSSHVKANYGCKSEMGIIVTEMEITMVSFKYKIFHVCRIRSEIFWSSFSFPFSAITIAYSFMQQHANYLFSLVSSSMNFGTYSRHKFPITFTSWFLLHFYINKIFTNNRSSSNIHIYFYTLQIYF